MRPGAKKGNASRFTSFKLPLPCTVGGSRRSHFKCWFWWTLYDICTYLTWLDLWLDGTSSSSYKPFVFFLHLNVTENHRKTPMFQQSSFAGVYSWSKRVFTRLPWRPSDDRDVNQWWSEFLGWAQGVIFGDTILRSFKIHEMWFFWVRFQRWFQEFLNHVYSFIIWIWIEILEICKKEDWRDKDESCRSGMKRNRFPLKLWPRDPFKVCPGLSGPRECCVVEGRVLQNPGDRPK